MVNIDSMYNELEVAQSGWTSIYDLLKQAKYDLYSPRQAIEDASVELLNKRILLVLDILQGIRPVSDEDVATLILSAITAAIQSQFNSFNSHAQSILNQLRTQWREGIVIRDTNNNFNCQFVVEESVTATIDFLPNFTIINNAVNQLILFASQMLAICKANGINDLATRSQALAEVVRETEILRNETKKLAKTTEQSSINADEKYKGIQDVLSQSEAVYSKIQALQQQTERESASITALIAQIKTTGVSADTLEQQIAGYQSKFEAFQSQLDSRLKLFTEFESKTIQAEKDNQKRETEIDRLTEKADTMIRGATTAGLSKSLEDTRDIYSKRMFWARIGFFVSIAFITLSAFPLAAHLLPGLFGNWVPAVSEQAQNSKFGILGKVFLLLPATWLTVFFTKSFAEFFHLEREYAHKAALAKSVEGFKREAPTYQEEITGSVFGEILNNPSNRNSPEPANHPLYEILTKQLTELFRKKADKS